MIPNLLLAFPLRTFGIKVKSSLLIYFMAAMTRYIFLCLAIEKPRRVFFLAEGETCFSYSKVDLMFYFLK